MTDDNLKLIARYLEEQGIALDEGRLQKLSDFQLLVDEANKRFNLTAITDERDFAIKHFADSLLAAPLLKKGQLCDIGAGAGFPSVPLAIAREDIAVTALDSTAKKINFIKEAAEKLGLANLNAIAGRAEEARDLFCKFENVTARAVASLPVLLELAAPLLKKGGVFFAYKTDESELQTSKNAQRALGMRHIMTKKFVLPDNSERAILVFEKIADTPPMYPRRYGVIKNKPL